MKRADLRRLVARGEGATLEFKRSTAELRDGLKTLCAFLNGRGGMILFGVGPRGALDGQMLSEQTLHELTQALDRFEPPASPGIARVALAGGREVLALTVPPESDGAPFTYDGRPYVRVGNTTRKMPKEQYEDLLLERAHARRRWENQPAVDVRLEDLDREEILRTREAAIRNGRISAGTPLDPGDILDRLGLRRNGVILQAAQVLYGTRFLPDYPQCLLKLGRFRGTTVVGDIIDNRHEYLNAFAMVRETMSFLERMMPLSAYFPPGKINREDHYPIPIEAIREIVMNAVMHRDYADPGGYVAVAVFDDRIEIVSIGRLPNGVTVESLSGPHISKRRNLLIADVFHRTGAVEIWGRGTNRVIDLCRESGIEPPSFKEVTGAVVVTFQAPIGPDMGGKRKSGPGRDQVGTKTGLSPDQVLVLSLTAHEPQPIQHLMEKAGRKNRTKFREQVLRPLLVAGLLEMTIPDKPQSSRQRYRATDAGKSLLASHEA